mmetsp:Transcript_174746/g.554597  ORF Transcript_174746/g.554597 Transcript_174746/m.554597 type:complete len:354 (+) Transcript_174746:68-1129(+)
MLGFRLQHLVLPRLTAWQSGFRGPQMACIRNLASIVLQEERETRGLQRSTRASRSNSASIRIVEEMGSEASRRVTSLITAAKNSRDWAGVERALAEASELNTVNYNAAMSAALKCRAYDRGIELYEQMCAAETRQTLPTYTAAIGNFARGQQYTQALQIGQKMMQDLQAWEGISRDEYFDQVELAYMALIDAAAQVGDVEYATSCLEAVRAACSKPPSIVLHGAALNACKNSKNAAAAQKLLAQMRQHGIQPNIVAYACAMAAHRNEPLASINALASTMREDCVEPTRAFLEEHVATLIGSDLPLSNLNAMLSELAEDRLQALRAVLESAKHRGIQLTRMTSVVDMQLDEMSP